MGEQGEEEQGPMFGLEGIQWKGEQAMAGGKDNNIPANTSEEGETPGPTVELQQEGEEDGEEESIYNDLDSK